MLGGGLPLQSIGARGSYQGTQDCTAIFQATETIASTGHSVVTTGEKGGKPACREDMELSSEKTTLERAHLASVPYTGKGTPEDKALILKQDLRIIPLCAFIYLLCYLDRWVCSSEAPSAV